MKELSRKIRKTTVQIIHNSGASHIGSALSSVEILNSLFHSVNVEKIKNKDDDRDRIILSKGHGTAVLYAAMHHWGLLSEEELNTYFKNGSLLHGHATHFVSSVEHSTGALGHGLPVGLGIAIGLKARGIRAKSFVVVGDGELHEGSNWEAMMLAGHLKIDNLCVLIDRNNLSQMGNLKNVCDLEPFKDKLESFNFNVMEVNGHNEDQICNALEIAKNSTRPVAIICKTIKGKGISFMENNILWHYRCPQGEDFDKALMEL